MQWASNPQSLSSQANTQPFSELAIWLNSCVVINELSGSGFECRYSHLNFRYCACFEQEVP